MALSERRFASPAKVNLGLRILGRRADGFHSIQSILQMLDLCDWLVFFPNGTGTIALSCNVPSLPTDDRNLVVRAAKHLQRVMQVHQGIDIQLEKSTPIAAGLGGGSSNAALTLLVLNRLWEIHAPMATLQSIAAALGSDVPFFLDGPTAIAEGRGEILSPLASPSPLQGILLNPGFGVPAGWAYGQFCGPSRATDEMLPSLRRALAQHDLTALSEALINDLEPGVAAVYPVIYEMQEALRAVGAQATFMSGSGPTVGGFFAGPDALGPASLALRQCATWSVLPFSTLSVSPHPELQG